ncbi:MAP kinase-interacting serine/threonine-protein kinase mnk-1-like [Sycon ciliatum]|uniref:MAP kinase-interacting serine/threonine-protein kinase mnk-1-like n=1 Tax=Sycon ciliatum TaxID=27933 RepID=UPI0031F6A553
MMETLCEDGTYSLDFPSVVCGVVLNVLFALVTLILTYPRLYTFLCTTSPLKKVTSDSSISSGLPSILKDLRIIFPISARRQVQTFKARDKSSTIQGAICVKCFPEHTLSRYMNEVSCLKRIQDHAGPSIHFCPRYIASLTVERDTAFGQQLNMRLPCRAILMEFIPWKLCDYLSKGVSTTSALHITESIFSALSYLHDIVGLAHHDIKPDNIGMVNHESVKIFDFDLSVMDGSEGTNDCGTISFLSPELVTADSLRKFSCSELQCADIFAAGLCVWVILTSCDRSLLRGELGESGHMKMPYLDKLDLKGCSFLERQDKRRIVRETLHQLMDTGYQNESELWWADHQDASTMVKVWNWCTSPKPAERPSAKTLVDFLAPLVHNHVHVSTYCIDG